MKRGTVNHPKMARLARVLNVPRVYAIGIMEALWHFTATYAPNGDLSRYSASEIIDSLGVESDRDPESVIDALVESKWLDRIDGKIIVHDWNDHCDDATHAKLARSVSFFANGEKPHTSRLTKDERTTIEQEYARRAHGERTASAQSAPGGANALPSPTLPSPTKPSLCAKRTESAWDGITEKDRVVAEHLESSLGKADLDLALRYAASQDPKIDRPYLWIEKCASRGRYPWRRPNLLPQSDRKHGSRFHVESRTDYSRLPYTEVIDGETVIHHPGKKQGAA